MRLKSFVILNGKTIRIKNVRVHVAIDRSGVRAISALRRVHRTDADVLRLLIAGIIESASYDPPALNPPLVFA